jgi:colanic acid/amylovoran biosynthesis glycosyltransferase
MRAEPQLAGAGEPAAAPAGRQVERPPVSVIVPFAGTRAEAEDALRAVRSLPLRDGDEVVFADNTKDGIVEGPAIALRSAVGVPVTVVRATDQRSAYYARNVAAERARNDWLLFTDADCRPAPTLLDEYFSPPPGPEVGAIAGRIAPAAGQDSVLARWAASREVLSQAASMELPGGAAAATANLLVRRAAWAELGGFLEGASLGTEFEFCWRLQDAGWRLEYRPEAVVEHLHRETLRAVLRQFAAYAAGDAWLNRRRPGAVPRPRLVRPLARCAAGIVGFSLRKQFGRAGMKAIDAAVVVAQAVGYLRGNAAPRLAPERPAGARIPAERGVVVFTDRFPTLTEQFVTREIAALGEAGWGVRVEAVVRPDRPLAGGARGLDVHYIEDEGPLERAGALIRVAGRHPLRSGWDLILRRRFAADERMPLRAVAPAAVRLARGGEVHVHVHFAAMAAANALRIGRLCGVPVSITPHSYDIYAEPRSLAEKLRRAAFVTTVCAYNVRHLREIAGPGAADRIHELPLGIDPERHQRRRPYPGGRTVLGVGRLVPQKGFRHLVEAAAILEREDPLDRLVIAGGGPLGSELRELAEGLGVAHRVLLAGPLDPGRIASLLEEADLLAVPSVVAPDGNRDALPVVVYEAMAMEVPVVATDEVGLPEVVRPEWGRVVGPGDPRTLAEGISELLALPAARRAEMGAAARAFVVEHRDVRRQAAALADLIESAQASA